MVRSVLALFLLLGLATPAAQAQKSTLSPEKIKEILAVMKEETEKKKIPGAALLLYRKGYQDIITGGQRDIEAKALMNSSTIFRIASMTKPITSVAAMILVDEGKLKVTDPLSKYVPEFREMKVLVPSKDGKSYELVKAKREITIHDLLTHSSGISYRLFNKPFVGKMYVDAGISDGLSETAGTIGDNVKKLAKLPLVCQPGEAWEYGLNTDVLGYVIEVVSGKTLDEFLREKIFKPLEMNDTHFVLPKEKRSRLAALYSVGDGKLTRVGDKPVVDGTIVFSATTPLNDANKYYSGGAGLVTTLEDYARFCRILLYRGQVNRTRILKAETVDRMTRNQLGDLRIMFPGNDLMGYGLGVLSEKGKENFKDPAAVGTYAWGGAFGTYFWVDPKNDFIGIAMVQVYPPDFSLAEKFKRLAYEAIAPAKK